MKAKVGTGIEAAIAFKGPAGDCKLQFGGCPAADLVEALAQQQAAQTAPTDKPAAPSPATAS